jgi:uncharacterized membrane-anchored protein
MNRRVEMQLRLQETVEGLSIAAISYYVVSLLGYGFEGIAGAGVPVNAALLKGLSIPVVVLLIALGVRKIRKSLPVATDSWRA